MPEGCKGCDEAIQAAFDAGWQAALDWVGLPGEPEDLYWAWNQYKESL